jgi:hypothetical protein
MGFLTAVVGILDSVGNRVDLPSSDGTRRPIMIQLDEAFEASSAESGGFTVVTLSVPGAGAPAAIPVTSIKANQNYAAAIGELVRCNPDSGGPLTVTLPTAVGNSGRGVTLKNVTESGVTVTVATTSSQTIDGEVGDILTEGWDAITYISDGANWMRFPGLTA